MREKSCGDSRPRLSAGAARRASPRPALPCNQLQPIPKRIKHMAAPHFRNAFVFCHFDSRRAQARSKLPIIAASQSWMRLLRRTKILLHTQMKLHAAAGKPASAALGQLWRLRHIHHSQHSCVEGARLSFFAGRHRQLNVIDRSERSFAHPRMLTEQPIRENRWPPAKIKG